MNTDSLQATFYRVRSNKAFELFVVFGRRVQKIERVLSSRFTTARLRRFERWYTSCADSANNILATPLAVVRRCQAGLGGVLLIFQQNIKIEKTLSKSPN